MALSEQASAGVRGALTPQDEAARATLGINTIRTLGMDAVQKANSGHPGTPMALAPVAYTLWQNFLRFDPDDPLWPNRDRFVLSDGPCLDAALRAAASRRREGRRCQGRAASTEPAVTLDDIKQFRQIGSRCPGHPEYRPDHRASRRRPARSARAAATASAWRLPGAGWRSISIGPIFTMFDYDVYAVCGDGDMMEGVVKRGGLVRRPLRCSATFAGSTTATGSPSKGIRIWRSATMSRRGSWPMAGTCSASATPTIRERAGAGNRDLQANRRRADPDHRRKPSSAMALRTSTTPAPPTASRSARRRSASPSAAMAGPRMPNFSCLTACASIFRTASARAGDASKTIGARCSQPTEASIPTSPAEIERMQRRELPEGWDAASSGVSRPTRRASPRAKSSGKVLNAIASALPLADRRRGRSRAVDQDPAHIRGAGDLEAGTPGGRNMHFGVREHAMGAILNGLALSKVRAFGAGFLIFSRLHEAADPSCRADGASGHLCLHARLDRRRRGRPDASAGRAARRAARASPDSSRCARPTPTRSSKRGASSSGSSTSRPVWC